MLSDHLLLGVVERVVALVQRAQGAYEFEVQPLREYFAARHLYNTAPYSPTGDEQTGSKPARFAAIARNPYWLNVTRFYAGCYSSGELASLIHGLKDLRDEETYAGLSYPRTLAATLLGDWVFSQSPRSIRDVMSIMFDAHGLAHLAAVATSDRSEGLSLANPHARSELVNQCWNALNGDVPLDYALRLCELVRTNSERSETADRWMQALEDPARRSRMLSIGLALGHLSSLADSQISKVTKPIQSDVALLWRARKEDFLERNPDYRKVALDLVLDGRASTRRSNRKNALNRIASALDFMVISFTMRDGGPIPLAERLRNQYRNVHSGQEITSEAPFDNSDDLQVKAEKLWESAEISLTRTCDEWATSIEPWQGIVEHARETFGDRWILRMMAAVAAGIRSQTEKGGDAEDLFDVKAPLCSRSRYARLKAGVESFWDRCLNATGEELKHALLLALVWASERAIAQLSKRMSTVLDGLCQEDWEHLFDSVELVLRCVPTKGPSAGTVVDTDISMRLAAVLSLRGTSVRRISDLYAAALAKPELSDSRVLRAFLNIAEHRMIHGKLEREELEFVRRAYQGAHLQDRFQHFQGVSMSTMIAREVCRHPGEYPRSFFVSAEKQESVRMSNTIVPVAKVAERDKWFVS